MLAAATEIEQSRCQSYIKDGCCIICKLNIIFQWKTGHLYISNVLNNVSKNFIKIPFVILITHKMVVINTNNPTLL